MQVGPRRRAGPRRPGPIDEANDARESSLDPIDAKFPHRADGGQRLRRGGAAGGRGAAAEAFGPRAGPPAGGAAAPDGTGRPVAHAGRPAAGATDRDAAGLGAGPRAGASAGPRRRGVLPRRRRGHPDGRCTAGPAGSAEAGRLPAQHRPAARADRRGRVPDRRLGRPVHLVLLEPARVHAGPAQGRRGPDAALAPARRQPLLHAGAAVAGQEEAGDRLGGPGAAGLRDPGRGGPRPGRRRLGRRLVAQRAEGRAGVPRRAPGQHELSTEQVDRAGAALSRRRRRRGVDVPQPVRRADDAGRGAGLRAPDRGVADRRPGGLPDAARRDHPRRAVRPGRDGAAIVRLLEHPDEAREQARRGYESIARRYDFDAYIEMVARRLEAL